MALPRPSDLVLDLPHPDELQLDDAQQPVSNQETPTGLPKLNPVDFTNPVSSSTTATGLQGPAQPPTSMNPAPSGPSPMVRNATSIAGDLLKYGGAAAGAALAVPAAAATGPFAPAVEAAAGATGYAVGAGLADQLDQLIGTKEPPKTKTEVAQRTAENLKQGTGMELGGRIIGVPISAGLNLAAGGMAKLAVKGPEAVGYISEQAAKLGINLTPAEILGTKSLSALESILDNLPWTSGIVQRYRLGEMQKLNGIREKLISEGGAGQDIEELGLKIKAMADSYLQKIGTVNKDAMMAMKNRLLEKIGSNSSYDALDISAKEAVQRYQQDLSNQVSTAYKAVAEKIPDTPMVPKNTISKAQQILADQERIAPSARNNDLIRAAKFFTESQNDIPEEVLTLYAGANPVQKAALEQEYPGLKNPSTEKTYQDLAANVQAFNQKKYAEIDVGNGRYQITNKGRQWDELIDSLHQDMSVIAGQTGNEELLQANNVANQLFKKKLALFDDPAFKAINNKYPGAVSKSILQSGNSELISRYKALVGDDLFGKAKDRLTNDIVGLNENDTVIGDDIRARILKLGESAKSIYDQTELDYFRKLANAVDIREGATNDLLNNPLLKTIIRKGNAVPAGIAKALVVPDNAGAASAIETLLGSEAKKQVADAFLPDLLATNQAGDFKPQTFAKEFDKYGEKTLTAWYGPEFTSKLKQLAVVGRQMGGAERLAGNPSGTGRFLIGFYEGSRVFTKAIHAVASGFSAPAVLSLGQDGAMILGSRQLAKLYTSPAGRQLFIEGLLTPAESKTAGEMSGRILAILANERSKNQQ